MWGFPKMRVPQQLDGLFHGNSNGNSMNFPIPLIYSSHSEELMFTYPQLSWAINGWLNWAPAVG
jgi:hypothetical protein